MKWRETLIGVAGAGAIAELRERVEAIERRGERDDRVMLGCCANCRYVLTIQDGGVNPVTPLACPICGQSGAQEFRPYVPETCPRHDPAKKGQ